jgi:hypothetical protein
MVVHSQENTNTIKRIIVEYKAYYTNMKINLTEDKLLYIFDHRGMVCHNFNVNITKTIYEKLIGRLNDSKVLNITEEEQIIIDNVSST